MTLDSSRTARVEHIGEVSNGAAEIISLSEPYQVSVTLTGASDMLFHAWNCEAVKEKAESRKGSKAKKTDNIESYVWRNESDELCIPGKYLRGSVVNAAKFRQDPRSPRKSAMDLYKAAVIATTELASLGKTDWDYLDQQRVFVQRQGITRTRPAIRAGWQATFSMAVLLPEYISPAELNEVITMAGKLIGVGDDRPTHGRFYISNFQIIPQLSSSPEEVNVVRSKERKAGTSVSRI